MTDDALYTPEANARVEHRRKLGRILVLIFVVVVLVAEVLTFVSRAQTSKADAKQATYENQQAMAAGDGILVDARVLDVLPASSTALVRLTVVPKGRYAKDGGELAVPINLDASGFAAGSINLPANEIPAPISLTLNMAGDTGQYPLDRYQARLDVTVKAIRDGAKSTEVLPLVLKVASTEHDWVIRSKPVANPGTIEVGLSAKRGSALVAFAFFELLIMLLLAAMAIAMTYAAIVSVKPLEFSLFVWLVAMLFALPAVRNTMPGVPAVGTLADYAVYFWALVAVACCLIVAALIYIQTSLRDRREHQLR